jgi:hypothetical protein
MSVQLVQQVAKGFKDMKGQLALKAYKAYKVHKAILELQVRQEQLVMLDLLAQQVLIQQ